MKHGSQNQGNYTRIKT